MQDNEFDRILDSVLAGYARVEPPVGMERRVMNRIDAPTSSFRWLRALGYAAALALLLIGVAVRYRDTGPLKILIASPAPPAPTQMVAQAPAPPAMRPPHHRRKHEFPRIVPLTREERALVALVELYPKQTEDAYASLRRKTDEPIEIQAIQILPLETGGNQ